MPTSGSFTSATSCPRETANYVPEILAAIIIANHPTQYGFDDVTLDPPVLTDTVTINYSIDLRLVSDLVGAPVDEIEALNPSLLRMVTPPDASFDLHLPAGTATLFEQRVALIPEARRNSWRYHPVVAGDTLASVAQEYRVPVAELASANQLDAQATASRASRRWWCPCPLPPNPWLAPGFTPSAAAIPWSPLPTASASPSANCAAGTASPPASGSNRAAACTWPSPPRSAPPRPIAAGPPRCRRQKTGPGAAQRSTAPNPARHSVAKPAHPQAAKTAAHTGAPVRLEHHKSAGHAKASQQ